MGRAVYPHELCDEDFTWLLQSFQERRPQYFSVESTCLPVVLVERTPDLPQFHPTVKIGENLSGELPIEPGVEEE